MTELVRLKSFLVAAEHLNFSEAAKNLHLAQSTISHHIKGLEQEMGVELFDRTGGGLAITEAGRLLLPWAQKIVQQFGDMQEVMASLDDGIVGHLRIACSTTAGKYVLPQLAARFCQIFPMIRVSILACMPPDVTHRLLGGEVNLGVVSTELNDPGLEYQVFFRDSINLIVSKEHPWAFRTSVDPEELIQEPFIMREHTSGTRRVMLSELAKFDISEDDLNVFLELGNAEAIVRTVAAGYGISFVSSLASACPLERGNVVDIPVRGLDLHRTIYMIRTKLTTPNRAQDAFWSFIHDHGNIDLIKLPETGIY
jgi:DNA-binding transcriptional LysR family regulator